MTTLATALLAELDDQALDELAELLAPRIAARMNPPAPTAPWLNASDAATYLATTRDRLYDLVQLGRLMPRRDGRRLLFRRDDLDDYLEGSRGPRAATSTTARRRPQLVAGAGATRLPAASSARGQRHA